MSVLKPSLIQLYTYYFSITGYDWVCLSERHSVLSQLLFVSTGSTKIPYIGQMNTFEQKIFQYSASTTLQRSATTVKFCSCLQITVHYVPPQFNKLPKSSRLKDRHIFHQTVSPTLLLVRNGILVWEEAFNAVYIRSHGQMGLLSSKGFLLHHPSF